MARSVLAIISLLIAFGAAAQGPTPTATEKLRDAELAFAKSMADRDFVRFGELIADDAVFLNGGEPLRGKTEILRYWKQYFVGDHAPFTWKPDITEVNLLGTLGTTTGPVANPAGKTFARFYSMWRKSENGTWQIVFDNGYPFSEPESK
jgi:ketosteroid isomerase-like protein